MGTRRKAILVALVVVGALTLFVCAGAIAADSPPIVVSVSATIHSTIELTMPTTSVTWGAAVPGTVMTSDITASVNSNKAWSLKVTKNHDLQNVDATQTILSSNFKFTATAPPGGTGTLTATEFGTGVTVVAGVHGSGMGTTISYSLNVPWDQEPDTYLATHTYTATQP